MKGLTVKRVVAGLLAVLLLGTAVAGVLHVVVSASPDNYEFQSITVSSSAQRPSRLIYDERYTIKFRFVDTVSNGTKGNRYKADYSLEGDWTRTNSGDSLEFYLENLVDEDGSSKEWYIVGTLKTAYKSRSSDRDLQVTVNSLSPVSSSVSDPNYTLEGTTFDLHIYDSYLRGSGTVTSDNDGYNVESEDRTPQIVVENMVALDSAGNPISVVTKDTPSFTLEVVFADLGLYNADVRDVRNSDISAYITGAGGFILNSSAKGSVVVASTNVDYPRFRARFTDVTYSGTGNELQFSVFYILDNGNTVKGDGSATLFTAKNEEDDEDDDKLKMAAPKIIISQYSYGEETITAGDEFDLNFSILNTSALLPLENVVITLTPESNAAANKGPGLTMASSSNSIYVSTLAAGESKSYTVAIKAMSDAEVTSHLINIKFEYEYIDTTVVERVVVSDLNESIAIPVSQIDRFSLDPITDTPYAQVGDEAYLTVSFINKGKSTTYNVSGRVEIDESVTVADEHLGNLEAGASDTLDFYLTPTQPGEYPGEVIISYEDENNNMKEVSTSFTLTVEEPWFPNYPDTDMGGMDMEDTASGGAGILTVILCIVGGVAIAVPLALYLMKRVRVRAEEEFFDEGA